MYQIIENNKEIESFNEEKFKRHNPSPKILYIKIIVCFSLFFGLFFIYLTWLNNSNKELYEKHINYKKEIFIQIEDLKEKHLEEIQKSKDKYLKEKNLLEGKYLKEKKQSEDQYLMEKEFLLYKNLKDMNNYNLEMLKKDVDAKVVFLYIHRLRKKLNKIPNLSNSIINKTIYEIIEKHSNRIPITFKEGTLIHIRGRNLSQKLQYIKKRNSRLMVKNHSDQIKNIKIPPPCQDGIDVVLTWVNGSDPIWIEKIKKHFRKYNTNNGRFRDMNSLLFSIRSIYEYAPYIKNYYIVTDNQTPSFLNTSNLEFQDYKLTIVDHSDIFLNKSDLPVFNSNAIEANIHRIKGLKKCFLYLNDDLLLGNYEHPNYFIENNRIKVRFSNSYRAPNTTRQRPKHIWFQLMENTNTNINRILNLPIDTEHYFPCHNFHLLDRDIIFEYQDQLKEEYITVSRNKGRKKTDMELYYSFAIYNYEKYKAPKAQCSSERYYYQFGVDSQNNDIMIQKLLTSNSSCICVNDNAPPNMTLDDDIIKLNIALEMKYPYPSPFEKREVE